MSTLFVNPAVSAALLIIVKATVLLGVAAIVQALLYRWTSAATRHLVWTLGIVGVLLLPVLSLALPDWTVAIRAAAPKVADRAPVIGRGQQPMNLPTSSASLARTLEAAPEAPPASLRLRGFAAMTDALSSPAVLGGVYAAGVIIMLIQLAVQRWNIRRLAREATDMRGFEWTRLSIECAHSIGVHRPVRLLRSRESSMPMAFGTRRPAILLPALAATWPDDRRRAVVLHELAHVVRYDCLVQTLAFAACTVYWFHPAAWWVARRLRIERELACDDRVIAAGTQPRDYAGHLLEIAYTFGTHRAPALAVSMARPRQLEGRMLAVLDAARNRSVPALRTRIAGAAIAAALLFPLASARAAVVAIDPDVDLTPVTSAPLVAPPEHPAAAQDLKTMAAPLRESARGIVRPPSRDQIEPRLGEAGPPSRDQMEPRFGEAGMASGQTEPRFGEPGMASGQTEPRYGAGTWEIRPSETRGTVHLRLVEVNSSSGSDIPVDRLEGLTAAQLAGGGGPVQFRLRRDAGVFNFEGVLRNGVGAGTFSFTADQNFPAELAKRGFARPTADEQYQMARHDVGYAFLDELNTQGYAKPQTSELVRAGQHGVHVTYLHDMGALGYRLGSLEPLIELRDHGVTPVYVRELAEQGYKGLPADDLRRARDHGITPEYVRAMRDGGYGSLTMEQLINARDHGVSAQFVRELGDAGYRKLPLEELIRVRDHGVTPEYVRDMRQLGHDLPIGELVRARDHGVDVEFVRGMAALGFSKVSMDSLVRVRDHGVTPKYAQELKALGYDSLTVEDLVTLRDHGLTPDRIRAANARAGTRLPIDMLKSLAAGGMR
jgi:beta-lactamase regulating signal transducer with metallopeptidase domain